MKPLKYMSLVFIVLFTITSCSTEDDNSNTANPTNDAQVVAQIEQTVESGTWKITNFIDSGDNETSDYNNYSFTFNTNGNLTATNGSNTIEGTWSVTDSSSSSSSDDDSSDDDDIDFNIFFPSPANFNELSDDWDIVSRSDTKIELIDISGGNGGTDLLTFEKN